MKKLASYIALSLFALVALLPLSAQGAGVRASKASAVVVQDGKNELYEKFHKNMAGDINAQKLAYEAAKEYLQKYPKDADAKAKEIRDWVTNFENRMRPNEVLVKVYREKNYPEAYALGKEVLATEPENLKTLVALGYAGMLVSASGNREFTNDAMTYAQKAIQLIEAGGAPADWKPFAGKDETLGWLNFSLGLMSAQSMPGESITYFSKAASYEGAPKKDPTLYYYLASLHEQEYQKMSADYKTKYESNADSPEAKAALAPINSKVDLIIDAYARLIAYMDADPASQQRFQTQKPGWMTKLTTYYKFRHNDSDAGLKELIESVRTKPLAKP